jgi:hypothetical protein
VFNIDYIPSGVFTIDYVTSLGVLNIDYVTSLGVFNIDNVPSRVFTIDYVTSLGAFNIDYVPSGVFNINYVLRFFLYRPNFKRTFLLITYRVMFSEFQGMLFYINACSNGTRG